MEDKIEDFLSTTGSWKIFIEEYPDKAEHAILLSINVVTVQPEEREVYFDLSMIYTLKSNGQKQVYKSGLALLNEKGEIKKVVSIQEMEN